MENFCGCLHGNLLRSVLLRGMDIVIGTQILTGRQLDILNVLAVLLNAVVPGLRLKGFLGCVFLHLIRRARHLRLGDPGGDHITGVVSHRDDLGLLMRHTLHKRGSGSLHLQGGLFHHRRGSRFFQFLIGQIGQEGIFPFLHLPSLCGIFPRLIFLCQSRALTRNRALIESRRGLKGGHGDGLGHRFRDGGGNHPLVHGRSPARIAGPHHGFSLRFLIEIAQHERIAILHAVPGIGDGGLEFKRLIPVAQHHGIAAVLDLIEGRLRPGDRLMHIIAHKIGMPEQNGLLEREQIGGRTGRIHHTHRPAFRHLPPN